MLQNIFENANLSRKHLQPFNDMLSVLVVSETKLAFSETKLAFSASQKL